MKSRTSFFDKTVLKKDRTRFFPLWALYLIGGLLIMHILSGFYGNYFNDRGYSIARDLNTLIGPMSILSGIYGFLAAQLLFGDLHNTRLCYGIHALPLRREGWYLTHTIAGLLMGLVPPLVIVLTLMPLMGSFWYTALLCWGGMTLHYLFFFSLAVLCMMLTGNRFAATAIYGILNFLSLIVQWFAQTIYIPLLPGVRSNTSVFNLFSPVVELTGRDDFFRVEHLDTCQCYDLTKPGGYIVETGYDGIRHEYGFLGLGDHWGYLWILAVVGIALLAAGLLLYRIRHLERAGDFMAFKPMKPIFLVVYSLCVGAVLFYLANETSGTAAGYVFLIIGLFIGYFTGKMLLERTIRVFKGRSFAGLGILYAAMALSLLLTWVDPIGISRRIPKAERVETIYLYDGRLSDYQINNTNYLSSRTDILAVTDPADMEAIRQAHSLMVQEHQLYGYNGSRWITLQYKLKNGSTVSRSYCIDYHGEAWDALKPYLSKPSYLFGVVSLEQLQQNATKLFCSELGDIPESLQNDLLQALWKDAQAGYLSANSVSTGEYMMYVEMRVNGQYRAVFFSESAPYTQPLIKKFQTYPQVLLQCDTLEKLIENTYSIQILDPDRLLLKDEHVEFLTLLWKDCKNGNVSRFDKFSSGIYLEIKISNDYLSLSLSPFSQCAQWLAEHASTST